MKVKRCAIRQCQKFNLEHPFSILVAPKITVEDKLAEPQKLKAGSVLSLYANIEGVPTPKVSWFHNDEPVKSINGTSIDTKDTFTSLTVKGSTGKNSGKYKLVAENAVGKDEKEFDVTVRGIFHDCHSFLVGNIPRTHLLSIKINHSGHRHFFFSSARTIKSCSFSHISHI